MATLRESLQGRWSEAERSAKLIVVGLALVIVAGIVWMVFATTREDYRTLFSQLSDTDTAALVDALKKQKVPYRLSDDGTTISVPSDRVHETRLQLMSANLPLNGGVGFEIFDKQGLGATEQSQRIAYQRALQGELARTIATLDNVKQARVHLVLPDTSLFKRDKQEATAAVTLTLHPNSSLDRRQIMGVQRLVAAAVIGLDPARVVITDQRGITLSASDSANISITGVEARLELQHQVESHIAQKISRTLDAEYGPGKAIISVAAALSFDAVKTTTQDVLPARGAAASDMGVVRRRQVMSGVGTENVVQITDSSTGARNASSSMEIEYEHGRRVEEVIGAPGAIRRLTVGVIVPPTIDEPQQERIKKFVQVAAGVDELRGDVVSIQSLRSADAAHEIESPADGTEEFSTGGAAAPLSTKTGAMIDGVSPWTIFASLILILGLGAVLGATLRGKGEPRQLSDQQRTELLQDIRRSLGEEPRIVQAAKQ